MVEAADDFAADVNSIPLGRVSPRVLEAVRQVEALEQQPWYDGWVVTAPLQGSGAATSSSSGAIRTGRTLGFDPTRRTLLVQFDGSEDIEACRPDDLSCRFDGDAAVVSRMPVEESTILTGSCSSEQRALLWQRLKRLFTPGSRFDGTIAIPGMIQAEGRQRYVLEVISEAVDHLGAWSLLVRHAAYDDEQACNLTFRVEVEKDCEPEVTVSYADGETRCEGVVNFISDDVNACSLRGRVLQFLQGEEGFLEPSEEVTHYFELTRSTCCEAEAAHARRIEAARKHRLEELCSWLLSIAALTRDTSLALRREIPWRDIVFRDIMRSCEVQCASLRSQVAILSSLRFTTVAHREQILQELRQAGLTRHAGHDGNDAAILRLKTVLTAAIPAMRQELDRLHTACQQATHRLHKSYCQLDRAIRSVESRLPRNVIHSWRCAKVEHQDATCVVCVSAIDIHGSNEELVRLPCGHTFHMECVSQWLHGHTTCPNCRFELANDSQCQSLKVQTRRG